VRRGGAAHREAHGREQAGAEGGAAVLGQEHAVVQHAHDAASAAKPERRRRRAAARVRGRVVEELAPLAVRGRGLRASSDARGEELQP
jgi:hypothetical protein